MDTASFEERIDRYGGDLTHWPARERVAADGLLASSPAAQALLRDMQDVEAMLRWPIGSHSADALDRMTARATRHRQETRARSVALRAGVGTAAAAVLALGVLVGGVLSPPRELSADRVLAAALDSGGAGDVD